MKKALNLLTVMLLTLVAGSFLMLGCSNPTDGSPGLPGSIGSPGVATFSGGPPELLEAYFENANIVYLVNGLASGTYTVPAGKTLAIVGNVNLGTAAINAFYGNLDLSDAGVITGSGVLIVAPGVRDDVILKSGTAAVPPYLELAGGLPETPATGAVVVTGLPGTIDSGTDLRDIATGMIYVLGDVSVNTGTSAAGAVTIAGLNVLGDLLASGSGGLTVATGVRAPVLKASDALTITAVSVNTVGTVDLNGKTVTFTSVANIPEITSGASGGTIALGAGTALPEVVVDATDITVTTTGVTLTVDELSTPGAGKLVLPGVTVTFTATEGGGKIGYAALPARLTLSSDSGLILAAPAGAITGVVDITGDLTVDGNLTVSNGITATGDLRVNGNLVANTAGAIAVAGALSAADVTLTVTANNLVAGPGSVITGTLTSTVAQTITVMGSINELKVTVDGSEVTALRIETITGTTSSIGLTVKGGFLAGETTLGTNITAKNIMIVGSGAGISVGKFDGVVGAGMIIVVGSSYTDGSDSELIIGGVAGATLDLDDSGTGMVGVPAGGKITFAHENSKLVSGADATKVLLSASWTNDENEPVSPSKVTIAGAPDYVLTGIATAGTGTSIAVTLGSTKYTFTNNAVDDLASEDGAAGKLTGSITAGARTTLMLVGSS
jgi:hypothetical protein